MVCGNQTIAHFATMASRLVRLLWWPTNWSVDTFSPSSEWEELVFSVCQCKQVRPHRKTGVIEGCFGRERFGDIHRSSFVTALLYHHQFFSRDVMQSSSVSMFYFDWSESEPFRVSSTHFLDEIKVHTTRTMTLFVWILPLICLLPIWRTPVWWQSVAPGGSLLLLNVFSTNPLPTCITLMSAARLSIEFCRIMLSPESIGQIVIAVASEGAALIANQINCL